MCDFATILLEVFVYFERITFDILCSWQLIQSVSSFSSLEIVWLKRLRTKMLNQIKYVEIMFFFSFFFLEIRVENTNETEIYLNVGWFWSRWYSYKSTDDHKVKNWKQFWPFLDELYIKWFFLMRIHLLLNKKSRDSSHTKKRRKIYHRAKVRPRKKCEHFTFNGAFAASQVRNSSWKWKKNHIFLHRKTRKTRKLR